MLQGRGRRAGKSSAAGGSSPGAGRGSGDDRSAKLSEQDWLELWAFGTSRDGLGLEPPRLWCLTRREYYALRKVYDDTRKGGNADATDAPVCTQTRDEQKAHLMTALMMASAVSDQKRRVS